MWENQKYHTIKIKWGQIENRRGVACFYSKKLELYTEGSKRHLKDFK